MFIAIFAGSHGHRAKKTKRGPIGFLQRNAPNLTPVPKVKRIAVRYRVRKSE
jgi:hypothetical protein